MQPLDITLRAEKEDPEFVRKLLEEFYVDDFNSGADSVEEAFTLYQKTKS